MTKHWCSKVLRFFIFTSISILFPYFSASAISAPVNDNMPPMYIHPKTSYIAAVPQPQKGLFEL